MHDIITLSYVMSYDKIFFNMSEFLGFYNITSDNLEWVTAL